jgi:hypothetical protein
MIRGRSHLLEVEPNQRDVRATVECDGADRLACVAELVVLSVS